MPPPPAASPSPRRSRHARSPRGACSGGVLGCVITPPTSLPPPAGLRAGRPRPAGPPGRPRAQAGGPLGDGERKRPLEGRRAFLPAEKREDHTSELQSHL